MNPQRKALIVASDTYDHDGLRHLVAPAADAVALANVLGDPQIGDFDVHVVRNEPTHVIQAEIEDLFSEGRPNDVLLLHFSCHGLKSESGELFFAARNTRPDRLGSTAISADFVQRSLRASRSRSIVLLLDCCYGGAFSQGVTVRATGDVNVLDSFPSETLGGGRGRAVITASSAMEYAFEGDQLADDHTKPSVFTTALVDGLATGEADLDEDGWVSLNELYDYVFDTVRARNPHQTPSRDIQMSGELYLARSRRRRIRALPVPPDLQAAMTDPNMFSRLGAVTELRSRLASDNLPVAAGAYEALIQIAQTDIQYVAESASAALREAALEVAERDLDFGRIGANSEPPRRTVRVRGFPLARAFTFKASHNRIRIDESPDGFDVSIDTATVGRLQGTIAVTSPTGEATITVEAEVTPNVDNPPPTPKPNDSAETTPAPAPTHTSSQERPRQPMPGPAHASPPATAPASPQATTVPPAAAAGATPSQRTRAFAWPIHTNPHISALIAGPASVLLGLVALAGRYEDFGFVSFVVWLIVYGGYLVSQSLATGMEEGTRRVLLAGLGAYALLGSVLLMAEVWQPVVFFFLISGVVQVVAALRGGPRPTLRLEIASGTLGALVGMGVVLLGFAGDEVEVLVAAWMTVLGILLITGGLQQRKSAGKLVAE